MCECVCVCVNLYTMVCVVTMLYEYDVNDITNKLAFTAHNAL